MTTFIILEAMNAAKVKFHYPIVDKAVNIQYDDTF